MIDASPTACKHGSQVKGLEVIALDRITSADPRGVVDAEVPVAMRQAVYDRVAVLEMTDPRAGYRVQQIHDDGCRTLATVEAQAATPAEMFDSPTAQTPRPGAGPAAVAAPVETVAEMLTAAAYALDHPAALNPVAEAEAEAPVVLAPVGPRGATVTQAQTRAYALADALRAAAWDVMITIENTAKIVGVYGERTVPAVRVVTLTATRLGDDGVLAAEWYSVTDGGRRTTKTGPATWTRGGKALALRTRAALVAALAEAVDGGAPAALAPVAVTSAYPVCRECGSRNLMHVDGCRAAAVRAEIATRPLTGRRAGEAVPTGWALFVRGTERRTFAGVFAAAGEARRYASSAVGSAAAAYRFEVRAVA